MNEGQCDAFKGRHFTANVILWALQWYLAFPVSYRDLSLMLSDRGVEVDRTTISLWVDLLRKSGELLMHWKELFTDGAEAVHERV